MISESEDRDGDRTFKNTGLENNFEVEYFGRENSVVLNHVYSNHINTNSRHLDSNHLDLNQLIPTNLANIGSINDSSKVCAIQ